MSIRQRRPFTVEIKGKRRKPDWASAGLELHRVVQRGPLASAASSNGDSGRAAAQIAADTIFRQSMAEVEGSFGSAAVQAQAAVQPRVLPDLTPQDDPIEIRVRQEAEEQAARRHRPRGPRRKIEAEATQATIEIDHETSVAQEIGQKVAPRLRGRKPGITLKAKAPQPAVTPQPAPASSLGVSARPMQNGEDGGSHSASHAAWRRARRKGLPMPLRAGERWKRRLPKSAR